MVVLLEVFERDISFSRRQSILTVIIFATIGGIISTPTFKVDQTQIFMVSFSDNEIFGLIQLIFYIVGGAWLFLMLYRNYRTAWSKKQKRIIRWLSWGVFFSIFFPFLAYIFILIFEMFSLIAVMISIIVFLLVRYFGFISIGIAFLKVSKEPWLLQRQKVHFLIVYSRDGIQLYSKVFNEELSNDRTILLSGGFSAITALFKEATETSGVIKSILLEDKELRIINKKNFICTILVDYTTQASEIAHENFTKEFEEMFNEDLEQFTGEVSKFEKAEEIVIKYFS